MRAGVVCDFLDAHSTLTLACSDKAGPWAADVYFVRFDRSLYFFSSPDSRHSRAIVENPLAAGTVHGVYEGWRDIRGVQLSGTVEVVSGAGERIAVTALYLAKFPFVHELIGKWGSEFEDVVVLHKLTPTAVYWVDNSGGFAGRTAVAW